MTPKYPPKVEAAKQLAKKWYKSHVIIIALDDKARTIETASYGSDKRKCAEAEKLGKAAHDGIVFAWDDIMGGY